MDLKLSETTTAGWTRLHVEGEVDLHTAQQLRERLSRIVDRGDVHIAVDMCDVAFLDSSGLGTLVAALKRLKERDGTMAIVCPDGPVRKVLTITSLDQVFRTFDSIEELPEVNGA